MLITDVPLPSQMQSKHLKSSIYQQPPEYTDKELTNILKRACEERLFPTVMNETSKKQFSTKEHKKIILQAQEMLKDMNQQQRMNGDMPDFFVDKKQMIKDKVNGLQNGKTKLTYFHWVRDLANRKFHFEPHFTNPADQSLPGRFHFLRQNDRKNLVENIHDHIIPDGLIMDEQTPLKQFNKHQRRPSFTLNVDEDKLLKNQTCYGSFHNNKKKSSQAQSQKQYLYKQEKQRKFNSFHTKAYSPMQTAKHQQEFTDPASQTFYKLNTTGDYNSSIQTDLDHSKHKTSSSFMMATTEIPLDSVYMQNSKQDILNKTAVNIQSVFTEGAYNVVTEENEEEAGATSKIHMKKRQKQQQEKAERVARQQKFVNLAKKNYSGFSKHNLDEELKDQEKSESDSDSQDDDQPRYLQKQKKNGDQRQSIIQERVTPFEQSQSRMQSEHSKKVPTPSSNLMNKTQSSHFTSKSNNTQNNVNVKDVVEGEQEGPNKSIIMHRHNMFNNSNNNQEQTKDSNKAIEDSSVEKDLQTTQSNNETLSTPEQLLLNQKINDNRLKNTHHCIDISRYFSKKLGIKINKRSEIYIRHFLNLSGIEKLDSDLSIYYVKLQREKIKKYLLMRYSKAFVDKIITYLECPMTFDLRTLKKWVEQFNKWKPIDILFFCFYVMDLNNDGLLCEKDCFELLKNKQTPMLEQDYVDIACFVGEKMKYCISNNMLVDQPLNERLYKVKDLTYKMYLKQIGGLNEPLVPVKPKKDTVYHLSYFSINHFNKNRIITENLEQAENYKKQRRQEYEENVQEFFKSTKHFSFNFITYQAIFFNKQPKFFYDLVAYLGLYQFNNIQYPYSEGDIVKLSRQLHQQNQVIQEQIDERKQKVRKACQDYRSIGAKAIQNIMEWEKKDKLL